jgi:hypothetical protein
MGSYGMCDSLRSTIDLIFVSCLIQCSSVGSISPGDAMDFVESENSGDGTDSTLVGTSANDDSPDSPNADGRTGPNETMLPPTKRPPQPRSVRSQKKTKAPSPERSSSSEPTDDTVVTAVPNRRKRRVRSPPNKSAFSSDEDAANPPNSVRESSSSDEDGDGTFLPSTQQNNQNNRQNQNQSAAPESDIDMDVEEEDNEQDEQSGQTDSSNSDVSKLQDSTVCSFAMEQGVEYSSDLSV